MRAVVVAVVVAVAVAVVVRCFRMASTVQEASTLAAGDQRNAARQDAPQSNPRNPNPLNPHTIQKLQKFHNSKFKQPGAAHPQPRRARARRAAQPGARPRRRRLPRRGVRRRRRRAARHLGGLLPPRVRRQRRGQLFRRGQLVRFWFSCRGFCALAPPPLASGARTPLPLFFARFACGAVFQPKAKPLQHQPTKPQSAPRAPINLQTTNPNQTQTQHHRHHHEHAASTAASRRRGTGAPSSRRRATTRCSSWPGSRASTAAASTSERFMAVECMCVESGWEERIIKSGVEQMWVLQGGPFR